MSILNAPSRIVCLSLCASLLFGCATVNQGYGVVTDIHQDKGKHAHRHGVKTEMLQKAKIGGIRGATDGGIGLGALALLGGILEIGSAGPVLVGTAFWAAIGAGTFGLAGVMTGGTVGYFIAKSNEHSEFYRFTVKSLDHPNQVYTVHQFSNIIPINAKVRIFEKEGKPFIRRAK